MVTAWIAASLSVALGLALRANAEAWSRDVMVEDGPIVIRKSFDAARHALLQDIGAALLGFGVVLMALLVARWTRTEEPGTKHP